jgi:acetyl-CoA carboxylase biotin carboxyl carrier protein
VSNLSFSEVGEILHLLQEVECAEIDLEWGELKIQVRKAGASPQVVMAQEAPVPATSMDEGPARESVSTPAPAPAPPTPQVSHEAATAGAASAEVPSSWSSISAPMAGTFYRSPSPGEPPFVEVGAKVGAGDTVALIEVMKLFTELKAEVAGKVARIDAEDGSLAEFGQPLVWIEPA